MNRSNVPLIVIAAVFLSFPLLWLYQYSGSSAIMLDKEKSMALTTLRQHHAILSERVLSVRSGFEQNFDALASGQQKASMGLNDLSSSLDKTQFKAKALLEQLKHHHQQRLIAVERFKSLHAKLTNSLRYLPGVQYNLLLQSDLSLLQKRQISQLSLLLISSHSYSDPDDYRKLNTLLLDIEHLSQKKDVPLLDSFVLHSKQLIQLRQYESEILQKIISNPIGDFFVKLNDQLTLDHDQNIIAAERLKYFLVFYSGALIILVVIFLINRYQLNQHLKRHKYLSEKDQLTGLNNRRYFIEQLERSIQQGKDSFGALIFIDLDGFKAINDRFGHSIGDKVLRRLASRLSDYCDTIGDRRSTIPDIEITLARLGGDEFVILLSDMDADTAEQQVADICKNILKLLSQPISDRYHNHSLSGSLGVAFFPDDGTSVVDIMHAADKAMYYSKEHGKNTYNLYHPDMAYTDKK